MGFSPRSPGPCSSLFFVLRYATVINERTFLRRLFVCLAWNLFSLTPSSRPVSDGERGSLFGDSPCQHQSIHAHLFTALRRAIGSSGSEGRSMTCRSAHYTSSGPEFSKNKLKRRRDAGASAEPTERVRTNESPCAQGPRSSADVSLGGRSASPRQGSARPGSG
jgi:hypothetical protein